MVLVVDVVGGDGLGIVGSFERRETRTLGAHAFFAMQSCQTCSLCSCGHVLLQACCAVMSVMYFADMSSELGLGTLVSFP